MVEAQSQPEAGERNEKEAHHTMNGIETIASILKLEEVELMPCYSGNPLIEEVTKAGIRPAAFRHERGGVPGQRGGRIYHRHQRDRGWQFYEPRAVPGSARDLNQTAQRTLIRGR